MRHRRSFCFAQISRIWHLLRREGVALPSLSMPENAASFPHCKCFIDAEIFLCDLTNHFVYWVPRSPVRLARFSRMCKAERRIHVSHAGVRISTRDGFPSQRLSNVSMRSSSFQSFHAAAGKEQISTDLVRERLISIYLTFPEGPSFGTTSKATKTCMC